MTFNPSMPTQDYDIVNVYFHNKGPYSFLVTDKRAYSTISKKLVNHLGISIDRSDIEFQVTDRSKRSYAAPYIRLRAMEFLGQYLPETSMIMVELSTTTIFGLIGTDILENFIVTKQDGYYSLKTSIVLDEFT